MIVPGSPPLVIPTTTFNTPTPSFTDSLVPTNVLTALCSREEPDCANISQFRTTTNIVLSSLTTIFACTWVALHLNNPSTNKSWWRSFWRRFRWMILALIAPEVISGMAMIELSIARDNKAAWNTNFVKLCSPDLITIPGKTTAQYKLALEVKKHDGRWTLTHGFLSGMDGIRLYDGDEGPQTFSPTPMQFGDPKMRPAIQKIGLISTHDIADKSKGDWITKFFVVVQTTWFIIQCLARWAAHLPVTELEVVTLAYAVLNIFIYALLWHKPQSLAVPFRIFFDGQASEKQEVKGTSEEDEVSTVGVGEEERIPILRQSASSSFVDEESKAASRSDTYRGRDRKLGLPPSEFKWVAPTQSGFQEFLEVSGLVFFSILSGTIFGALHLVPLWLSDFPSEMERKLWQVSAFYVAVAPLGTVIAGLVIAQVHTLLENASMSSSCFDSDVFAYVSLFFAIVPYAAARVILLVLTFTTLRSLPKAAFQNVEWTRFIPHF